jgi:3-hydroxyacyl-CoA dehydrogenase
MIGAKEHIDAARANAAVVDSIAGGTPLIEISQVGLIGAGTMGGGIAMNFLTAGIPGTLIEREPAMLDKGVALIRRNYGHSVKRGRLSEEQVETAIGLLTPSIEFDDVGHCDLVIEAVYEEMNLKKEIFARLDKAAKPGTILASNTSYLNIDEIAAQTLRPQSVLGMHFFSPANIMKLLEVVRGARTGDRELATVMNLAPKIGKVPVVSGVCPGFIGNRMLNPRQEQALTMLMEGAAYNDIDDALLEFGFPMGPFQMSDLAGLDIGWHRDPSRIESISDALCAAGRWGQKTGKGYYDYDDSRNRAPSDEVRAIVEEFARKLGKTQRRISKEEIRERLLYPMINEAAKILDEGIAQRASDIDTVWLNGYGWPAWSGGPTYWADQIGLKEVAAGLERFGMDVSPYLRRKAETGGRFNA